MVFEIISRTKASSATNEVPNDRSQSRTLLRHHYNFPGAQVCTYRANLANFGPWPVKIDPIMMKDRPARLRRILLLGAPARTAVGARHSLECSVTVHLQRSGVGAELQVCRVGCATCTGEGRQLRSRVGTKLRVPQTRGRAASLTALSTPQFTDFTH